MRVAVTGSFRVGKSTLIESLSKKLQGYEFVEEPYMQLEENGHMFSHPPDEEDYRAMLEQSLEDLEAQDKNSIFDRCPIDFIIFLQAIGHKHEELEIDFDRVASALASLDLIIFTPIEEPDRLSKVHDEFEELREQVDLLFKESIESGFFGLIEAHKIATVSGSNHERTQSVLRLMDER